jgi:hypothetical protein
LLGIEARIDVLLRRRAAHQADHCAGGSLAGFLNIDAGEFLVTSRVERGGALARLGDVRARAKLLNVVGEGRGGAGAQRISPGLLVLLLAGLLFERGEARPCLGDVGAGRFRNPELENTIRGKRRAKNFFGPDGGRDRMGTKAAARLPMALAHVRQ